MDVAKGTKSFIQQQSDNPTDSYETYFRVIILIMVIYNKNSTKFRSSVLTEVKNFS